jgi:hypothetical protein
MSISGFRSGSASADNLVDPDPSLKRCGVGGSVSMLEHAAASSERSTVGTEATLMRVARLAEASRLLLP